MYRDVGDHARLPQFFNTLGVADDFDGRFDLLVIHVHLLIRRLRGLSNGAKKAQQHLFDVFIGDLDQGLRMSGVGDIGIGHRVKKMTHAYYGRAVAYDEALDGGDHQMLVSALHRNLFRERDVRAASIETMASYIEQQDRRLAALNDQDLLEGIGLFEQPEASAA
jgi:cytochrome b pre-mRNA-processing protein 3